LVTPYFIEWLQLRPDHARGSICAVAGVSLFTDLLTAAAGGLGAMLASAVAMFGCARYLLKHRWAAVWRRWRFCSTGATHPRGDQ